MTSKGLNSIYPSANDERIVPVFHKSHDTIKSPHEYENSYYDTSKIENIKTVIINTTFQNQNSFYQFINLEFTPNVAKLKFVSVNQFYDAGVATFSGLTLSTDLGYLDNGNLISFIPVPHNTEATPANDYVFSGYFNSNTDIEIKLPNFTNKSYNFYLSNPANEIDFTQVQYFICLTIEFIKYKTTD